MLWLLWIALLPLWLASACGVSGSYVGSLWGVPPWLIAGLVAVSIRRRVAKGVAASHAGRIEVRAERITVLRPTDGAREITTAHDHVLTVRGTSRTPRLAVVGTGGDSSWIDVRGFDIARVGEAALAHGWRWQPPGSSTMMTPPTNGGKDAAPAGGDPAAGPAATATEILLRNGRTRPMSPVLYWLLLLVDFAVLGPLLAIAGLAFAPGWVVLVVSLGLIAGLLVLMIGAGALVLRLSRVTITVDRDRVSVRYGSLPSARIAQRSSVASSTVGKRWVRIRMRGQSGKSTLWVPLRPRSEEVLTALRAHGWPVVWPYG